MRADGAEWLLLLFSPRCLNLRNLVWHGFVTPANARAEYASLVTLLLLSLPAAPPAGPLWEVRTVDESIEATTRLRCTGTTSPAAVTAALWSARNGTCERPSLCVASSGRRDLEKPKPTHRMDSHA